MCVCFKFQKGNGAIDFEEFLDGQEKKRHGLWRGEDLNVKNVWLIQHRFCCHTQSPPNHDDKPGGGSDGREGGGDDPGGGRRRVLAHQISRSLYGPPQDHFYRSIPMISKKIIN